MRLSFALLLIATGVCVSAPAFVQAVVEGRVELPKSRTAPVTVKCYEIVSSGGVLATRPPLAVIYLDGFFSIPASQPLKKISRKDLAFLPSLLPVQVGTKVEFPNLDDTYHSIFSYSPAKRFDLGRYRPDERPVPSEVFDTPGLVTLRCEAARGGGLELGRIDTAVGYRFTAHTQLKQQYSFQQETTGPTDDNACWPRSSLSGSSY